MCESAFNFSISTLGQDDLEHMVRVQEGATDLEHMVRVQEGATDLVLASVIVSVHWVVMSRVEWGVAEWVG